MSASESAPASASSVPARAPSCVGETLGSLERPVRDEGDVRAS